MSAAPEDVSPRLAIVISKATFENNWGATQMSAHAWTAIAHLAGIPYDTLSVTDAVEGGLTKYNAVILVRCSFISTCLYDDLLRTVKSYLAAGGNIIVDGSVATFDEKGQARDYKQLHQLLAIENDSFHDQVGYRVKVAETSHYITRNFEFGEFLTQHVASGLHALKFKNTGQTLVAFANGTKSYPFLSAAEWENNRLVLVSDLAASDATAFFRNAEPQGFYANRIFEVLVRSVYWSVYGDLDVPFPAPQLTNANLTAIIRLDADASDDLSVQVRTIEYLIGLAKETGAVPVYGWVSSRATHAGWDMLSMLGKKLVEVGGEIATHSRSHFLSRELTEDLAKAELDASVEEIESHVSKYGHPIGKVDFFINPNLTIKMNSYAYIAERFSLYMTHGFEQQMPLGYGSTSWFTASKKSLVVLNSTPVPDYQWFYDPKWSYSTAQAAAHQEAIFEHLYHHIGRGVVFNQMWHDYALNSRYQRRFLDWIPLLKRTRVMNENNEALYDAMRTKFATYAIYFPDAVDLASKLRAMAQWSYSWHSANNRVEIRLNLPRELGEFTGGMGIRIENTTDRIQGVAINGKEHYAFRDKLVILPNLSQAENSIVIRLGPYGSPQTRLTFVSKRMPTIEQTREGLETKILTKSKGKFSFKVGEPFILLNADWQEWNRKGDSMLNGYVTSDRRLLLRKTDKSGFIVSKATVPILGFKESQESVTLLLGRRDGSDRRLHFRCANRPAKVLFNGQALAYSSDGRDYQVALPELSERPELKIVLRTH